MDRTGERSVVSRDRRHRAVFRQKGTFDPGPAFYALTLDRLSFGDRLFGEECLWSPDSRYLAVQEWTRTDDPVGPAMRLVVIDVEQRRECVVAGTQGRITPKAFEDGRLRYVKRFANVGTTREFTVPVPH